MNIEIIDSYFIKKGFEIVKARDMGSIQREYQHVDLGIVGHLYLHFECPDCPKLSLYFHGQNIKKVRSTEYKSNQLDSLFSRVDRILREARKHKDDTSRKIETTKKINDNIIRMLERLGFTLKGSARPWTLHPGVEATYRGFEFFVTDGCHAEFMVGVTRICVTLERAKKIIDILYDSNAVPELPSIEDE